MLTATTYIFSLFFRISGGVHPILKCRKVFQSLIKLSIEELCETADSLISPVRLGVVRPTAPFSLPNSPVEIVNVYLIFFLIIPSIIYFFFFL